MHPNIHIAAVDLDTVWQIRREVMWPNKSVDFVKLPADAEGKHLGLFANEDLTSVISIFSKNDEIQFRKFATVATHQRKGYGTALLKHVFDLAVKLKAKRIWCNARHTKKSYYEKFQMAALNAPFEKSGILYVTMEKRLTS